MYCLLLYHSCIREIKGVGGLDSVGVAVGDEIADRVSSEIENKIGKVKSREVMLSRALAVTEIADIFLVVLFVRSCCHGPSRSIQMTHRHSGGPPSPRLITRTIKRSG
jgi:hypothetical protein